MFTSAADSSGTITDGTSSTAERIDASHSAPIRTLARPAGIDAHVTGSAATSSVSRRAHTSSGTSIRTR